MRYTEIGKERGAIKAKKKRKKKGRKNEIYFSHLSRERAFYLKRLFFYSRTYMSTTKGGF